MFNEVHKPTASAALRSRLVNFNLMTRVRKKITQASSPSVLIMGARPVRAGSGRDKFKSYAALASEKGTLPVRICLSLK